VKPAFISSYDPGIKNKNLQEEIIALDESAAWKDLSLVILIPSVKYFPPRVVASWLNLINPPNGKLSRIFAVGMEVGDAYNSAIQAITEHPIMGTWRYLLTLEHDNVPPPDGIMKLMARMESKEGQDFAAIGGLYFTKGPGGVPQIWGDPRDKEMNFRPQKPSGIGELVECCGTGMGFTLFRMSMFKDGKISKPWFQTTGNVTQDLYFWQKARSEGGYRCAVDCNVRVGHYDVDGDEIW
jgi:hypothetical protein